MAILCSAQISVVYLLPFNVSHSHKKTWRSLVGGTHNATGLQHRGMLTAERTEEGKWIGQIVTIQNCMYTCICNNTRGDRKKPKFICKKLCIYSYMFKLQSPSKNSPFDAVHLLRLFFTAQNSIWTHWFGCLLVLLLLFSPLPHLQNVSLWELFYTGKQTNKQ